MLADRNSALSGSEIAETRGTQRIRYGTVSGPVAGGGLSSSTVDRMAFGDPVVVSWPRNHYRFDC